MEISKVLARKKWKIQAPLQYQTLLLLLSITLLLSGCAAPRWNFTRNDYLALQNIYEESNWNFSQSSLNIRVNEGGAIKLSIAGEAVEKSSTGDSSIWIPVALLRELPEYYGIDGDDSSPTKLMAYKVKGGLWSIVALIPKTDDEEQIRKTSTIYNDLRESIRRKRTQTRKVNLEVLMISPIFRQSLPLILPIGQGKLAVQTSIELPAKSKFTSLQIVGNEVVKLTELPSSISEGKVKALARLQPQVSTVWGLSNVSYQLSKNAIQLIQWVALYCVFTIFVWIGWEILRNEKKQHLEKVKKRIIYEYKRENGYSNRELYSEDLTDLDLVLIEARSRDEANRSFKWWNPIFFWNRSIKRFWFYAAVAILIIFVLILLISSTALSQDLYLTQNVAEDSSLVLGNLQLSINSSDYNSSNVKATLSFYPLSTRTESNKLEDILIEFGDKKAKLLDQENLLPVKVDVFQADPNSSRSAYKISNIPTKKVADLKLLTAASQRNVQIDQYDNIADIYYQALTTNPRPTFIQMNYEIGDVLLKKEQIPDRYFSWFPIDKTLLEIPIRVEGAKAIVSEIKVEVPVDFYTQIQQDGIENMNFNLERDENFTNKYLLRPGANKFILINSGNKVTITGKYERNLPGRAFLTWVLAIIGGGLGLLIGLISSNWKSLWQGIGVSLGSSLLAFLAVIVVNKDFQSIISLRGQVSLFDIFLFVSFLSLVGTAILMRKSIVTVPPMKKRYIRATWSYFGVFSFLIPILLATFLHP